MKKTLWLNRFLYSILLVTGIANIYFKDYIAAIICLVTTFFGVIYIEYIYDLYLNFNKSKLRVVINNHNDD